MEHLGYDIPEYTGPKIVVESQHSQKTDDDVVENEHPVETEKALKMDAKKLKQEFKQPKREDVGAREQNELVIGFKEAQGTTKVINEETEDGSKELPGSYALGQNGVKEEYTDRNDKPALVQDDSKTERWTDSLENSSSEVKECSSELNHYSTSNSTLGSGSDETCEQTVEHHHKENVEETKDSFHKCTEKLSNELAEKELIFRNEELTSGEEDLETDCLVSGVKRDSEGNVKPTA